MRCVTCSSPVGYDEAVFAPHPEYQDLQPYCMECMPPDYPDYPDDYTGDTIDTWTDEEKDDHAPFNYHI